MNNNSFIVRCYHLSTQVIRHTPLSNCELNFKSPLQSSAWRQQIPMIGCARVKYTLVPRSINIKYLNRSCVSTTTD